MKDDRCRGCRYSFYADVGEEGAMLRACEYILQRGERRPCPPGEKCTVFEPRRGRKGGLPLWAFSRRRA